MARIIEHRKALELRNEGKSYGQIKQILGISKSTLSGWLRKYPLSREQINLLRANSQIRIERYRNTMRRKREGRMNIYYQEEKKKWLPYSKRELFIAGVFLYWGEGNKVDRSIVSINNTDPDVIKFAFMWLVECLNVPKDKIHIRLHLYSDMNVDNETEFWRNELSADLKQFGKPYIKLSKKADIDQKGFGHGTCCLAVHDTVLKERLLMLIKASADLYSKVSSGLI